MRRHLVALFVVAFALAACAMNTSSSSVSQFWRPISEPNILLASDTAQKKLDFDLSQCHCGIYPANAAHNDVVQFQTDKQRLAQTGVTVTPNEDGQCLQKPSLVVSECMRQRGWEPTNCSGRVPTANGGSLCAAYVQPDNN